MRHERTVLHGFASLSCFGLTTLAQALRCSKYVGLELDDTLRRVWAWLRVAVRFSWRASLKEWAQDARINLGRLGKESGRNVIAYKPSATFVKQQLVGRAFAGRIYRI